MEELVFVERKEVIFAKNGLCREKRSDTNQTETESCREEGSDT
jgi:hypothetical protein